MNLLIEYCFFWARNREIIEMSPGEGDLRGRWKDCSSWTRMLGCQRQEASRKASGIRAPGQGDAGRANIEIWVLINVESKCCWHWQDQHGKHPLLQPWRTNAHWDLLRRAHCRCSVDAGERWPVCRVCLEKGSLWVAASGVSCHHAASAVGDTVAFY